MLSESHFVGLVEDSSMVLMSSRRHIESHMTEVNILGKQQDGAATRGGGGAAAAAPSPPLLPLLDGRLSHDGSPHASLLPTSLMMVRQHSPDLELLVHEAGSLSTAGDCHQGSKRIKLDNEL
jgi:hypothetical protein